MNSFSDEVKDIKSFQNPLYDQVIYDELEKSIKKALESYSNVHRGTGQYSMITTELYESARDIFIANYGLKKNKYTVVFCTKYGLGLLKSEIQSNNYKIISGKEIGLPLGLTALIVKKTDLPKGIPFYTGGSVVKMVSQNSVIWANIPQKFEAGTPSIINAITMTKAFIISQRSGKNCFRVKDTKKLSVQEILYKDDFSGLCGFNLLAEIRKLLVGRNLCVPTANGENAFINFDNAASTPTFHPIWNAVRVIWRQPESIHREIVGAVRRIISEFLNAPEKKYATVFTCNTTEALNLAARLLQNEYANDTNLVLLNTLIEHNSNELPWRYIDGVKHIRINADSDGFIDTDKIENTLKSYNQDCLFGRKRIRLVSVSAASNVLGTCNDLQKISGIVHKYGARLLVDAAQIIAHRRVDMVKCDIDYLVFSGHKVYAPFGSGALLVKKELLHSAGSELHKMRESGEENIVGITAMGKAIILLKKIGIDVIQKYEYDLLRRLLKSLSAINGVEIFGISDPDTDRLSQRIGVVAFRFKKVPHNLAAKELAEIGGIGVRNGCFCAHLFGKHIMQIHPLRAYAANVFLTLIPPLTSIMLPGMVRVSIGLENDENDVDKLIAAVKRIESTPRSIINRFLAFTKNGTPFLHRSKTGTKINSFIHYRINKVYSPESNT